MNTSNPKPLLPKWTRVIASRRTSLDLKQEELAAKTGDVISQGNITDLERGKVKLENIGVKKAIALAYALDWSLEDLQRETGVDLGLSTLPPQYAEIPDGRWVYAVDTASASRPSAFNEASSGVKHFISKDNDRPGTRPFIARGDSMTPTIFDGDFCYCDTHDRTLAENKIFVFAVLGDGVCIKRAKKTKLGWLLTSDNPEHSSFSSDEVEIVGRVYHIVPHGKNV